MDINLITHELKIALENAIVPQRLPSLQRVDLICAYITRSGLNELKGFFLALASRNPPVPVRILTTSQFGTTEPEAIHELAFLPKVEIKVFKPNFPTLHAKGWHFVHHDEVSNVAIVGSSNMTGSALVTGIEWNICTAADKVTLEFEKVFESYWSGAHPAFQPLIVEGEVVPRMLEYNKENRDWESLCNLFPSKAEPQCSNIGCGHTECLKLRRELDRLETRRKEIVEKFLSENKEVLRQRSRPPTNTWNLPQTREDLLADLVDAISKDDVAMAREAFRKADEQSYPILWWWGSNNYIESYLNTTAEKRGNASLEVYDLRSPVLFAIAYGCGPDFVHLLVEKSSTDLGPFSWKSDRNRTETIFHVLARLQPGKAHAILTKIWNNLVMHRDKRFAEYKSSVTALEIANSTAQGRIPQDMSFYVLLNSFFNPR